MVIVILERILNRLDNMINRLSWIIEDMKGESKIETIKESITNESK